MELNLKQLETLKGIACKAALAAGKLIQEYSHTKLEVKTKDAGTSLTSQVVTEVDLKSQTAILELIEPTLKEFDLALLSEEKEDDHSRFKKDYFWAIDPLDGTLPFIQGKDGYAVSISLISKAGIPVIGVFFDPTTNNLYHSIKGHGAFVNDNPLSIAPEKSEFSFISDLARAKNENYPKLIEELHRVTKEKGIKSKELLFHGGAVMNVCWTINKSPACYFKLPKKGEGGGCIWDYGAIVCIFKEAGGVVSDCFNNDLNLNSDNVYLNECGVMFATSEEAKKLTQKIIKGYFVD